MSGETADQLAAQFRRGRAGAVFGHVIRDDARIRILADDRDRGFSNARKRAQRRIDVRGFDPLPSHSCAAVEASEGTRGFRRYSHVLDRRFCRRAAIRGSRIQRHEPWPRCRSNNHSPGIRS